MTAFRDVASPLSSALATRDVARLISLSDAACAAAVALPAAAREAFAPLRTQLAETIETAAPNTELLDLRAAFASVCSFRHVDHVVRGWIPVLAKAPTAHLGIAALALGDTYRAHEIAQSVGSVPVLDLIHAFTDRSHPIDFPTGITIRPALRNLESLVEKSAATQLWLGQIVQTVLGLPIESTASDKRWLVLESIEDDAYELARAEQRTKEFPFGESVGGNFVIRRLLRGLGQQQLWLAEQGEQRALVAYDGKVSRQKLEELKRAVSDVPAPGFKLLHAGHVETPTKQPHNRAFVESTWLVANACPAEGRWLPDILPPLIDPLAATRMGISLGRSAGQLLLEAAAQGTLLVHVRPEYMWAVERDGHLTINAVTDHPQRLFALRQYTLPTHPLFDRTYAAPEVATSPTDRSLVFTLARMIAEWAGAELAEPLRSLHARATRADASQRPSLRDFVDALGAVA